MHNVRLEFEKNYPAIDFVPVIGDVRVKERVRMVFELYHPQIVFHAAAYKHVPLMEENPCKLYLSMSRVRVRSPIWRWSMVQKK